VSRLQISKGTSKYKRDSYVKFTVLTDCSFAPKSAWRLIIAFIGRDAAANSILSWSLYTSHDGSAKIDILLFRGCLPILERGFYSEMHLLWISFNGQIMKGPTATA
jgi:hypothetical protein